MHAVDPWAIGQVVDGCRIERLVGEGASGALFAATDLATGEHCAFKRVLPPADLPAHERDGLLGRVDEEARALSRLDHPGIVRVFRVGRLGDAAWLRMELLPGCTLERYTQAARRLPDPVVLHLVARLADALAHAHAHGVVHRDLKPENVLVDWASDRLVLTDFGVARLDDAERTRTGLVIGSPVYMAPELLAGQVPDARSDLYALGVLLYQLLTGQLPFEADGLGALLRQVATTPAPDPAQVRPGLAPGVSSLVRRLLAKQPADRPASARALAQALQQLADAVPADGDGAKSRGGDEGTAPPP